MALFLLSLIISGGIIAGIMRQSGRASYVEQERPFLNGTLTEYRPKD